MNPEAPIALAVLLQFVDVLEELGIEYHLGGSYASSIHGIPRQTQDIDLVVDLGSDAVEPLATKLKEAFYLDKAAVRNAVQDKGSVNLVHLDTGMKIDLFMRGDSAYDQEEFARAVPVQIQLSPTRFVRVKSAEDILLRKLQWYRLGGEVSQRQWRDVLGIARAQAPKLDTNYLAHWAANLAIADLLEGIMQDARLPGIGD